MSNRTKRDLADTLKRLLQTRTLEKITVKELTESCGVSRMTFYYHFKDIYDLLEWMCLQDLRETAGEYGRDGSWQAWLSRIFEQMHVQKAYVGNINRSLNRTQIEGFWTEQIHNLLMEMVQAECARQGAVLSGQQTAFIASFYQYSFVGILMEWFDQGMKGDYEKIVGAFSTIMSGSLENAVRRFAAAGSDAADHDYS